MSKVRDLPPVSGSIIWARQVSTTWIYCSLTYKLYDVYSSSKARAKVRVIIILSEFASQMEHCWISGKVET